MPLAALYFGAKSIAMSAPDDLPRPTWHWRGMTLLVRAAGHSSGMSFPEKFSAAVMYTGNIPGYFDWSAVSVKLRPNVRLAVGSSRFQSFYDGQIYAQAAPFASQLELCLLILLRIRAHPVVHIIFEIARPDGAPACNAVQRLGLSSAPQSGIHPSSVLRGGARCRQCCRH